MDVLGDLVARDRRSSAPALRTPASARPMDYRRFCTTCWKAGNLLRNEGVRAGRTVAVADPTAADSNGAGDRRPEPLLALFGAALLGATVRVGRPFAPDAKAVVVPAARVDDLEVGAGTRVVAYGPEPDDPSVLSFSGAVWSENPTAPPDRVAPDDPAVAADSGSVSHADLLAAGGTVIDRLELGAGDSVAVRAPLARPGTLAAGVVAPLLVGGTVSFGPAADDGDANGPDSDDPDAKVVVVSERASGPNAVTPGSVVPD